MTTKALIIPAAGSGSRMNKETPKPYLEICGRTILEYSLRQFLDLEGLSQILVPTSIEYLEDAGNILDSCTPSSISARCVEGGAERQDSIRNALKLVSDVDLVLIHDAVRPFVRRDHIADCCKTASEVGGAVLGVPAKDTIKRVDNKKYITETPSRRFMWQAQTPQVFKKEIITKAYNRALEDDFQGTDDSSLVERLGYDVEMVEGDRTNFKITYPVDLKLAKLLIEKEQL